MLSGESPARVLFIHGAAGVGKSCLFRHLQDVCAREGRSSVVIDARTGLPQHDPGAARTELESRLRASSKDGHVVFLDHFEHAAEHESWLHADLLPTLDSDILLCIAGRRPPSVEWRYDIAWASALVAVELGDLSADELRELAERHGRNEEDVDLLQRLSGGFPLAATMLLTDAGPDQPLQTTMSLRDLLPRLLEDVPEGKRLEALEAASVIRVTTEPLLRRLLDCDESRDLYDWLTHRNFVRVVEDGVYPIELVREATITDLRRRDPERLRRLHDTARDYYLERVALQTALADVRDVGRLMYSISYLHRANDVLAPYSYWTTVPDFEESLVEEDDWSAIEAVLREREGKGAVRLLRHWRKHKPQATHALRNAKGELLGFSLRLYLEGADADAMKGDPATRAFYEHVEANCPLREGECMLVTRFEHAMPDADPGMVHQAFFLMRATSFGTRPNLAIVASVSPSDDGADALRAYLDFDPLVDVTVGDRELTIWGHDWRVRSFESWVELIFARELDPQVVALGSKAPQTAILDRTEFDEAVRNALRCCTRVDELAQNPLCRARVVQDRLGGDNPGAVLGRLLAEAVSALRPHPRFGKYAPALEHTFLLPIGTQEVVAERLNLPFSTYRRYLTRGTDAIAAWMWEREVGAPSGKSGA